MSHVNSMNVSGRFDGSTAIERYRAVAKTAGTSDFYEAVDTADEKIAGILQNAVAANGYEQSETIVFFGATKAISGGVIDEGDPLTVDNVGRVVEAKGTATVTSGANTSLDYTISDAGRGYVKSISYVDPGMANAVEYFEDLGGNIVFHLGTGGGGAIDTTADDLKTILAANATIAALISAADTAGHDGSGTLTAEPAVQFSKQNVIGWARESASAAGSEIEIVLGKVV